MDDGLSSFAPENIDFDVVREDVDPEEAADALKREKQLDEELAALDEFDDENESDSPDDSESSDEESTHSHNSKSEVCADQSSVKASYEHSAQPYEPNQHSALIRHEIPSIEHHSAPIDSELNFSKTSDINYSRTSNVNYSRTSDDVNDSKNSDLNDSKTSEVNYSENFHDSTKNEIENNINISNVNQSHVSDVDESNIFSNDRRENHVNYENVSEHKSNITRNQVSHFYSKGDALESSLNTFDQHDYGDISNKMPLLQPNYTKDLYEEFQKLQLLYKTRGAELEQVKIAEITARQTFENEIRTLTLNLRRTEGEKDKLTSTLQEAQNTLSAVTHENNILKGKLTALEIQFSTEKNTKEIAQAKLESAEVTIQSLEQQIKETYQSDNALRLQQQNENVVKDLKLRHQKEVLKYKEEIDRLRENLSAKITESDNFSSKLSQMQKRCEELQVEKYETFKELSAKLQDTQKQYKELLESGTISETAKLKLHLEHLQEEKTKIEKQNSELKDEIRSLKTELRTSEAVNSFTLGKESISSKSKKGQSSHSESDLKIELQQSLKNIQSLRFQNNSMKEKLDEVMHKLPLEEEKAKLFESRYKESDAKLRELEKKLEEVLPYGSIPISQHEQKVKSLESELAECQKKLRKLQQSFKISSSNEEQLSKEITILKNSIAKMQEEHTQEKIKLADAIREKCLEIHEGAIAKVKQELSSKAESELKTICWNYENNITQLKKEIQMLHEGLYDAKAQYVKFVEENKSKSGSTTQTKEQEEFEREIRIAYENKLKRMEVQFQNEKAQLQSTLIAEVEKKQLEWAKQKMTQIQKFVNDTKQQLDEEFVKCLEKEKLELEAERKKIIDECQQKINSLHDKYESEKSHLHANIRQKWDSEMEKLHQEHQTEIKSLTEKYENKIVSLETELKLLKEKSNCDVELKSEMESLQNKLKQHYEEESNNYAVKLREDFQRKWKTEIKELQQSHQNEVDTLKKIFQDKINTLEDEIKNLKENVLRDSKSEEIKLLKEEYAEAKFAWDNEKLDLVKNEHVLKNKLSTAIEIKNKLTEKLKKFKKGINALKTKHNEEADTLLQQNEELKKSIIDKENELQFVKSEYDSCRHRLEEKHQKRQPNINSASQTEDELVSRRYVMKVYEMFCQCLKKISEEVKVFLVEYRKRGAERLKKALSFYHDHLISKIFQDVLKDAQSILPNIAIPRVNQNSKSVGSSSDNLSSSPNAVQHPLNSNYKISNSTPCGTVTSGVTHKNLESEMNNISDVRLFQNGRSTPNIANNFADMSYDYVPIGQHDINHTLVKLPQYSMPGGLFNGDNVFQSYHHKDAHVK